MRLLALPAFEDNYIWALVSDTGDALIVDPGDAAPVLAATAHGLWPAGVLITHHHPDHCGGLGRLLERWPALPVFAPDDARIPLATERVGQNDRVVLGDWRLRVHGVPGHTASHIAFHSDDGLLFCGDALFSLGCGRLFESSAAQMLDSLDRLAALPGATLVCCGHEYTQGNAAFALAVDPANIALQARAEQVRAMRQAGRPTLPANLAEERECNPFLRVDAPPLRRAVAARLKQEPADRVEVFAELRRWKDEFRP